MRVIKCIIKGCGAVKQRGGLPFHQLPANEDRRNRWLKSIADTGAECIDNNFKDWSSICSRHFQKSDYSETRVNFLKNSATPSVFDSQPVDGTF